MSRPELMPDSFNNDPKVAVSFEVFLESIGLKNADLSEKIFDLEQLDIVDEELIAFLKRSKSELFLIRDGFFMEDFLDQDKKNKVIEDIDNIMANVEVRLNEQ